jgi:hypothetical protein
LALIPPEYVDAVVAIGKIKSTQFEPIATGFFFGKFISKVNEQQSEYRIFLVTNKHVINESNANYGFRLDAKNENPANWFYLPAKTNGSHSWFLHPDSLIDVAITPVPGVVSLNESHNLKFFRSESNTLSSDGMKEAGLTEGDEIFILGFPQKIVGEARNAVLVRQGCIARVRDLYMSESIDFYVDAPVFKGNSGGPVINKPQIVGIGDTPVVNNAYLIGILTKYISVTNRTRNELDVEQPNIYETFLDLGKVLPVEHIERAIQLFLESENLTD